MLTILDQVKLLQNPLQRGVIEVFPRVSPVLERLPFMDVAGNAYSYNQEGTLPSVGFRGINENYTESTGIINPATESLFVFGGDSKVDRALVKTQGNLNNLRATYDGLKAKSCALYFTKMFFKGDNLTNPKSFDGLQARITGNQLLAMGSTSSGDALTLDKLDALLDAVIGGPDVLFMNKTMRRKVNALMRAAGSAIETVNDSFGRQIPAYAGVPIAIIEVDETDTEILGFTEVCPGGGSSVGCSIYAVRFGAQEYVSGLQCGQMEVIDQGQVAGTVYYQTSIEHICGLAVFNGKAAARLYGIKNA